MLCCGWRGNVKSLDPFRFKWKRFCFLDGEANRKEGGEGRAGGPAKSG